MAGAIMSGGAALAADKFGVDDAGGRAAERAWRGAKANWRERQAEFDRIRREADARMGYGRVTGRPR